MGAQGLTIDAAAWRPLAGVRVLEAGRSLPVAYCGRLLADLGASVDVVPGLPAPGHDAIPGALDAWLRHGKGEASGTGAAAPARLLADDRGEWDIVMLDESMGPGAASAAKRTVRNDAGGRERESIVLHVTPYGLVGPDAGAPACELTVQHASGFAYHQAAPVGDPEAQPPMSGADREAALAVGLGAAVAAVWGLFARGRADAPRIDLSMQDFLAHLLIEPIADWGRSRQPFTRQRAPGQAIAIAGGLVWLLPCADGAVMVSPREDHQWNRWVEVLGTPAWSADVALCGSREARAGNSSRLQALMAEWSRQRPRDEVAGAAQAGGIACFPVSTPGELLDNEQLVHRRFFDRLDLGDGVELRVPGLPFQVVDTAGACLPKARSLAARRPVRGRDGVDGVQDHSADGGAGEVRAARGAGFEGVRVVDFTWVMAGPLASKMLAEMGAEVIKIESSSRPEYRNRGGWFDVLNNSKLSCSIDISTTGGQDLVRRLVARSDVLVENFSARVLARHGLSYDALKAIRPELIYVSASGVGRTGPQRDALAYGTLLQAYSGRAGLIGEPNPWLEAMGILPAWTDPVTGFWEVLAIASALLARRRTGCGAFIDLSMLESTVALLPEALIAAQGRGPQPCRTNDERGAVPVGCFRCVDPDGWVALSVSGDREWTALCAALGLQALGGDARFASVAGRLAARTELTAAVAVSLRELDSTDAERRLRAAGVPVARSRSISDLVEQEHTLGRGVFRQLANGGFTIGLPWTDERGWRGELRPAPALGADNDYVLGELLGLDRRGIAALQEGGVVR